MAVNKRRKPFTKCSFPCVVTRKEIVSKVVPRTVGARFKLLQRHGTCAFIMPEGTPASPGSPNFPVVNARGCFHCSMARAAYTRIGQSIAKRGYPREYKARLRSARRRMIEIAVSHADITDPANACNWALQAAKRYL